MRAHVIPSLVVSPPCGGHGEYALARPSSDSLSGRLRVGFAWRSPCAALRKAACAEGASGASFRKCAPPAAGGGPCCRASAPWAGRGGGTAAPQRPLHAGAALCCLVGSMLVLCATFSRLQWRCTASHGEWHAACAAPRLARTAPESALDGPACAARAPHKLTHRLPFSGRRRSISRLSIKTGGLCDAVYAIVFLASLSLLLVFISFFLLRSDGGGAGGR